MTVMNALMLFSVPFIGGHYLVDVLAGMSVFAVSLAVVKAISRQSMKRNQLCFCRQATNASPSMLTLEDLQ